MITYDTHSVVPRQNDEAGCGTDICEVQLSGGRLHCEREARKRNVRFLVYVSSIVLIN